MPVALIPHELSKPLSLRIKHTTDEKLRKWAETSKLKIGEVSRLLLDSSLEMLRQAHDSEGNRRPEIELPKPLEKLAEAAKKHGRKNEWISQVNRSVRDETDDNSKMIKALVTALYDSGSNELREKLKKVINIA